MVLVGLSIYGPINIQLLSVQTHHLVYSVEHSPAFKFDTSKYFMIYYIHNKIDEEGYKMLSMVPNINLVFVGPNLGGSIMLKVG